MTVNKASQILGVMSDISEEDLKKRYRELMRMTHPDVVAVHDYPYEVHEINRAYEYMLEHLTDSKQKKIQSEKKRIKWNAPVNPNAYIDRPIYQYYEDEDGERIGTITIDTGKYIWIPDEDFSLFLRSLYETAKRIISLSDEELHLCRTDDIGLLSDITYLIAGQFFSAESALSLMKNVEKDIYYTKVMLELDSDEYLPTEGSVIIPKRIEKHRLFVADVNGSQLGYLTFKDDRLPFGIIPLFERRAVSLKMRSCGIEKSAKSLDVDLWIKLLPEAESGLESVNLRIDGLLK